MIMPSTRVIIRPMMAAAERIVRTPRAGAMICFPIALRLSAALHNRWTAEPKFWAQTALGKEQCGFKPLGNVLAWLD